MANMDDVEGPPPLIHIGFPKAISSWLQKHLFQPKCGFWKILDPWSCQLTVINPSPFCFDPNAVKKSLAGKWAGRPSDLLVPVITSESLAGNLYCGGFNGKELADRLHQIAPYARILLLVREQRSLIRSLYKTWILWGMPHSIEQILGPLTPEMVPQFDLNFLRFDQRVAYYQNLFGKDRVLVQPFETFSENPAALLQEIHAFSGADVNTRVELSRLPVKTRVNRGETLAWLYCLRLQNRLLLRTPFNYRGLVRNDPERQLRQLKSSKKNPLPHFTDAWFEGHFSTVVSRKTEGAFAASNRRLRELTGINLANLGYEL